MLSLPDLLHLEPRLSADSQQLGELLGLAWSGREADIALDRTFAEGHEKSTWEEQFFARDLFVEELVREHFRLRFDGKEFNLNHAFLVRVLTHPPVAVEEIRFRQQILSELDRDSTLRQNAQRLYAKLYDLMNMFKVPGRQARLDIGLFRVDLFRLAKDVIDSTVTDFASAGSALGRLHTAGCEIQAGEDYRLLATLLDHVERRSTLNVDVNIGADGQISQLYVREVRENTDNPFYRSPWHRWYEKFRFFFAYGYRIQDQAVVSRLVDAVFERLAPSLHSLLQLLGHLEFYLCALELRKAAEERGLAMCLATFDTQEPRCLEGLFNPLLLSHEAPPVPNRIEHPKHYCISLITGPNSGGKTRYLQALGLAQLLAQSGIYTPARRANLSPVQGLFVSLIEHEAVEHAEGRLGRELERIRAMFDAMQPPSMVILDELCSGTNPSEATEVFDMVLRLLQPLEPVAYITTHFLDFAHQLEQQPPIPDLSFLQVEMDEQQRSTYQFIPGVAETSMATAMAERMGVTFGELSARFAQKRRRSLRAEAS